jgi:hypothetical protein
MDDAGPITNITKDGIMVTTITKSTYLQARYGEEEQEAKELTDHLACIALLGGKEGIKCSLTQSHFPKRFYSQDDAPVAPGAPDALDPTASSHMPAEESPAEESAKLACEFIQKTPSQHQASPVESSRVTRRNEAAERAGQLQAEMEEEKKKCEKGMEKRGGGCAECEGGTGRKEEDADGTRGVDERGGRDCSSSSSSSSSSSPSSSTSAAAKAVAEEAAAVSIQCLVRTIKARSLAQQLKLQPRPSSAGILLQV